MPGKRLLSQVEEEEKRERYNFQGEGGGEKRKGEEEVDGKDYLRSHCG